MLLKALPFALSYLLIPLVAIGSVLGGWWIAAVFLWGWIATSVIDRIIGLDTGNMDPKTQDSVLFWHKMVTWGWVPLQFALMIFVFWQVGQGHLGTWEQVAVAASLGVATGGIGITFAHEMVHQRSKWER
ncbi:MAG: alkane 1-monooxygenase, partial [Pseudomonadota bacterium]